jgi:hypothetical protein|tara:strand:+ start:8965 stop:9186 length:222 start_codon:yes stop_codon:yes gene_type:complete
MDYYTWNDKKPEKMSRREYLELMKYIDKYLLDDVKDKIAKRMLNDKQQWYLSNSALASEKFGDVFDYEEIDLF